jgi:hypothetical protein
MGENISMTNLTERGDGDRNANGVYDGDGQGM